MLLNYLLIIAVPILIVYVVKEIKDLYKSIK